MAKILVHAIAATAGGGATYLRSFLERLPELGSRHQWIILLPDSGSADGIPEHDSIEILRHPSTKNPARRVYLDQVWLGQLIRQKGIDAILATGNFGMLRPPVPQVLMNRNALYFSKEHLLNLRQRGEIRELLRTAMKSRLAMGSIRASDINIVPTHAFGEQIREYLPSVPPSRFRVNPHGFDAECFRESSEPLDPQIAGQLKQEQGVRRILMVSHYNYFRNFETLLRATATLKAQCPQPIELVLTTRLEEGVHDHRYDTTRAARLIRELGIADRITMLGSVPHSQLYSLYCQADVVVCPSYAETFGHPMVEGMAAGRPVVASNRPVHREVCQGAALHFSVFDPNALAACVREILENPTLAQQLGRRGLQRAADFSWRKHFATLIDTIEETIHQVVEFPTRKVAA